MYVIQNRFAKDMMYYTQKQVERKDKWLGVGYNRGENIVTERKTNGGRGL